MDILDIGFIGAGNLAGSLITGLITTGFPAARLWVADPQSTVCDAIRDRFGINIVQGNADLVEHAQVVILSVKPQAMHLVCNDISAVVKTHKPLVISVAAGIRCDALFRWLGTPVPLIRSMPNTPAAVGAGATALFAAHTATEHHQGLAESLLRGVGMTVWVNEEAHLDIVTALSGSGPAYFFLVMQALQQAGEQLGLDAETARLLTLQTAFGAAKMALESPVDVGELRQRVTSPGGTTEQALRVLMDAHTIDLFVQAVTAARNRSTELADQLGETT
jgi:pyrroline-5-carboxylate reductase